MKKKQQLKMIRFLRNCTYNHKNEHSTENQLTAVYIATFATVPRFQMVLFFKLWRYLFVFCELILNCNFIETF